MSSVVKNPPANEGNVNDTVSIPGSGRSLGRGHGNPLQHTSLENPTDRGAWRATVQRVSESDTATACTAACLSLVCPSSTCIVIFNPMWFLCILLLEEVLAQVQALQRVEVPACLDYINIYSINSLFLPNLPNKDMVLISGLPTSLPCESHL